MVMNALREGTKKGVSKFILFGFLVMATGGLVLMDVGGFFRGGVANGEVAKVGKQVITGQYFDRTVRRTLSRLGISPQEAYRLGYINQILGGEIRGILLSQTASDQGIRIGKTHLAQQVAGILTPYTSQGEDAQTVLNQILLNQGMSERAFVNSIAREMSTELLTNTVQSGGGHINQNIVQDLYLFQKEKRDIQYVAFKHGDMKGVSEASDEQLLGLYEKMRENFAIDETRWLKLITVNMAALKDKLDISDDQIRGAYEENIDLYTVNESRTLQQSIVETQGKAQAVADAARGGKSLEAALKSVIGNSAGYLGERDFEENNLIEDIKDDVLAVEKAGTVLGPLQSPLGYYVVVVKKINPRSVKDFKAVRKDIKDELMDNALIDEQYAMANTVDDLLASGVGLDEVAQEVDISVQALPEINQYGLNKDGKNALDKYEAYMRDILGSGFELSEGETSPIFETQDGKMMAVHVEIVTPRSYKDFEDVKSQLQKRWMTDQRRVGTQVLATQFLSGVKSSDKALSVLAKDNGMSVQTKKSVARTQEPDGALNAGAISAIFAAPIGEPFMFNTDNGLAVAVVTDFSWPKTVSESSKDYQALVNALSEGASNEVLAVYLREKQNKVGAKINQDLLNQVYGPEAQQAY